VTWLAPVKAEATAVIDSLSILQTDTQTESDTDKLRNNKGRL